MRPGFQALFPHTKEFFRFACYQNREKTMISGETRTVALIGDPVEHSLSPAMHNAAFEELGLDYVYVAFRVHHDSLEGALGGMRSLGLSGANVTIPHKSAVIDHLDGLDEYARKIGAVNTIKNDGGRLEGFNTDGIGALRALEGEGVELGGSRALLLGAGGAARAISFALVEEGAELAISNRTASRAKELASEVEDEIGAEVDLVPQDEESLAEALRGSDVLINSTSVGMHPDEGETLVESGVMHPDLTVMDIVYNPLETGLLREAEEAGAETVGGLEMLVQQGAASLEIWTGEDPPVEVMRDAARRAMEGD